MHHPQKKALPNVNQISSHHIFFAYHPLAFQQSPYCNEIPHFWDVRNLRISFRVDTVPCRAMPGTPLVFANRGRKMAHCGKPRELGFMILTGSKDQWMNSTNLGCMWLYMVVICYDMLYTCWSCWFLQEDENGLMMRELFPRKGLAV